MTTCSYTAQCYGTGPLLVDAGHVVLASGHRLTPDLIVLANGSTYPFLAKSDQPNNRQLDNLGVERVLGTALADVPATGLGEAALSPSRPPPGP